MEVEPMRVYLDACCLNRPFDDHNQDLIRMESEAVKVVLRKSDRGIFHWVSSEILVFEIQQTPDADRRSNLLELETRAQERVPFNRGHFDLARHWIQTGIKTLDALHLAAAEVGGVSVFLSTDKKLVSKVRGASPDHGFKVENPLFFLLGEKKRE